MPPSVPPLPPVSSRDSDSVTQPPAMLSPVKPPPPSLANEARKVVITSFTLAGDVSSFDDSAQTQFKSRLASRYEGVTPADVVLTIRPASILVVVEILTSDAVAQMVVQDLTSSSASDLSEALQQTVTALGQPSIQDAAVAAPPSSSDLAVIDSSMGDMLMREGSAISASSAIILAAVVGVLICAASVRCYCRLRSRRTRLSVSRLQKEFTGLDMASSQAEPRWPPQSPSEAKSAKPTRAARSTTSLLKSSGDIEWTSSTSMSPL